MPLLRLAKGLFMKKIILALNLLFLSACVSYSKRSNILVDTQSESSRLIGKCNSQKYQNNVELKDSKVTVYSPTFDRGSGGGIIIPFDFHKSKTVDFIVNGLEKSSATEKFLKQAKIILTGQEIPASAVLDPRNDGHYRIQFEVPNMDEVKTFRLLVPKLKEYAEINIPYIADKHWFFMLILTPLDSDCKTENSI
jgi:hypothetical protein